MEKVKINFDKVTDEVVEVAGNTEDKILVRKHIPYTEKEAMAYELAAGSFVIDDDGFCYRSYKEELLRTYLIVKHYTNIDVSEIEDEAGYEKVFDYLVATDLKSQINLVVCPDVYLVDDMAFKLVDAAQDVHEKKNGFGYKLMQTFGFLFNGEDLTDQIAAAEDINGKMIDMFKAVKERDEKNALLKSGKAKVNAGGTLLNMAKK